MRTEELSLYGYYRPDRYISRSFYISKAKMWLRAILKGHYAIEECIKALFGITYHHDLGFKVEEVSTMLEDVEVAYGKVLRIRKLIIAMEGNGGKNQYHEILSYHRKIIGKTPYLFDFWDDEFVEFMEGIVKQSVPFTSDRL